MRLYLGGVFLRADERMPNTFFTNPGATPRSMVWQNFIRLFQFVATPAVFWIGVAGLVGSVRLAHTTASTFVLMSPGLALMLILCSVALFLAMSNVGAKKFWALLALGLIVAAHIVDSSLESWHGERIAFFFIATVLTVVAAVLVFMIEPDFRQGLIAPDALSICVTLLGSFVSVGGAYLLIERDVAQGQHYVEARAVTVGQALEMSFDRPIGSMQRMTDRWRSLETEPNVALIQQEFRSHIQDLDEISRISLVETDGTLGADIWNTPAVQGLIERAMQQGAFWSFLDSVRKAGQAQLSTPGLISDQPHIAFIAAPLGELSRATGFVVATVDLLVLVDRAFADDEPPCCFEARANGVVFFETQTMTDRPPVAVASSTAVSERMFDIKITFWKEMLPGEIGWSFYPAGLVLIGLMFTFFASTTQRLAQLARFRARELRRRSLHDPLTNLPNRRMFEYELDQACQRSFEKGRRLSLLFIDMNGLRLINDSLGHETGDRLVVVLSKRLRDALPDSALLARLDGGEFVAYVTGMSDDELTNLARAILDVVSAPMDVQEQQLTVSAVIGMASTQTELVEPMQLVREADLAMLQAKREGSDPWSHYSEQLGRDAALRMILSQELKKAIHASELAMVYQPLVDAGSGAIVGMEALVRWHHQSRGVISPAEFIPMAEESGQIVELTNWTLLRACEDMKAMQSSHQIEPVPVAVNISPVYFQRSDCVEQIMGVLDRTGLPARQLQIEITEGMLVRDQVNAVKKLSKLRDSGVVTSLDDFGTGYSSLSYLRNLPVSKVKLDRSFVIHVTERDADVQIVRGVIEIVHHLSMTVVVEGVETAEQARLLSELNSDQFQGYLFSKPVSAAAMGDLLRSKPDFLALFKSS